MTSQRPVDDGRLEKFQKVESTLRSLLSENRSYDIAQDTLDAIRRLYLVFGRSGAPVNVPAVLNINLQSGMITDLPDRHPFDGFVKRVSIHDVLDAKCLRELDSLGESGRFARHAILDNIWRNVRARIAATTYKPRMQSLGRHTYPVHNGLVQLQPRWTGDKLADLFELLKSKGMFRQRIHDERFGIPFTSETSTNPDMLRQWSTDSVEAGHIQKDIAPHLYPKNMLTNAAFLITPYNIEAMLESVKNPEWYRAGDASRGMAHIFLPARKNFEDEGLRWDEEHQVPILESVKEDPAWFNRKRLESQALVMHALIQAVKAGAFLGDRDPRLAELGDPWGFHWTKNEEVFVRENLPLTARQKEYIVQAIQAAAMYLLAVQWNGSIYDFEAPSVSSWEEAPLRGGCASDTGFIVEAFIELKDLLFNEGYQANATVQEVRTLLNDISISHAKLGSAAAAVSQSPFADFRRLEILNTFIREGKKKNVAMVVAPVIRAVDGISRPTPWDVSQFKQRGPDSSLALLAAYHGSFDDYSVRDARIRLGIVQYLEEHLMDARREDRFGMKRYGTFFVPENGDPNRGNWLMDSYLNFQFNLGLIVPGLVAPLYAQLIERDFRTSQEYAPRREELDSLSPRDLIVSQAYERFVSRSLDLRGVESKKDAFDTGGMAGRQQFSLPEWSAQWSIGVTAAIIALARAKLSLLEHIQTRNTDPRAYTLLETTEQALTRFLNVALATIAQNKDADGQPVIRADGTELPAEYNVMEAYQVVPDVYGNLRFLPGDHTLQWSEAQLYLAFKLCISAARMEG